MIDLETYQSENYFETKKRGDSKSDFNFLKDAKMMDGCSKVWIIFSFVFLPALLVVTLHIKIGTFTT